MGAAWGLRPKPRAADVASAVDWTAAAQQSGSGGRRGSFSALGRPWSLPLLPTQDRHVECKSVAGNGGVYRDRGHHCESCPNPEGCAGAGGRPANAEAGSVVKMEKQILSPALDKLRKQRNRSTVTGKTLHGNLGLRVNRLVGDLPLLKGPL